MFETSHINRRRVIQGMGLSLGLVSLRGFEVAAAAPAHFTHGVASGDPLSDRVILWTRVLPGDGALVTLTGRWEVAEDLQFKRVVISGETTTGPERDHTVKVDATGLQPATNYWYRFVFNGVTSAVGRTRTLPVGAVEAFSLAVCSCSNYPQGYFNAYRDIAQADIDVVMHLGDYIYEYAQGVYANPYVVDSLGRAVVPEHEILVLEDYRQRYGLYRTDEDLQAAHAAHPWICVWDDHELANNTWHSGAQNHSDDEGDFFARMQMARKAYHEWMPIRTPAQTDQGPIYRSFQVGDLADIIMLDTRLEGRDEQLDYRRDLLDAKRTPEIFEETLRRNSERTLLGEEQFHWLANQLAASKDRGAPWQFLGQQVLMGKINIPQMTQEQLASLTLPEEVRSYVLGTLQLGAYGLPLNLDAWDGYPADRERVFSLLLELANNPVVVAGDTHNGWAFNLQTEAGVPVGVEVGCPGVTSPGLESYFPLPPEQMAALLQASSPELVDLDTSHRGWSKVTLTPEATVSQWRFVSTVLDREYTVNETEPLVANVDARRFS
ncbi:alkaline phosphatase D family protein [Luminiphilus sp. nBUS_07]|uniref:alkaline phosphatase D family protein n=1 Tax=Luminiphilus sp. nBUS_07 TaxID=3395314 RepID=UPI003EC024A7